MDCGSIGSHSCVSVKVFPVVHFSDGSDVVVLPMDFNVEVEGLEHVTQRQIPLRLWGACTVHKLQGWELDELMLCFAEHEACWASAHRSGPVTRNLQVAGF